MTTPARSVTMRCACGETLRVPEERIGAKVACPKCGTLMTARTGAGVAENAPSLPPRPVSADEAGKLCGVCQTPFVLGGQVVACDACGLPYHTECWAENGGCAAYGCTRMPKTAKAPSAGGQVAAGWGDVKDCPACGREIKSMALKCRWCGATFNSVDPISRQEFDQYRAEKLRMAGARRIAMALFFISLVGCTAPVMVFVDWIWVLKNHATLKRIPGPHLALGYASGAIAAFYCLLILVFVVLQGK